MVMLSSAVGQEERNGVVICPEEVMGKGNQNGEAIMPGPHQPVLTPDDKVSFICSPAAYTPRYFITGEAQITVEFPPRCLHSP